MATALIVGVVLAFVLVYLARSRPPAGEQRLYAVGLFTAALIYLGLSIAGDRSGAALVLELTGVLAFGILAGISIRRRSPGILAAGWAAHVLWDVLLHLGDAPGAVYTPGWYPWLCLSFDLVIAGAVVAAAHRHPRIAPAGPSK